MFIWWCKSLLFCPIGYELDPFAEEVQCKNPESCNPNSDKDLCCLEINECVNHMCKNGATCVDEIADYSCSCASGWEGKFCADRINRCAGQLCNGHGSCTSRATDYVCDCTPGFSGDDCEHHTSCTLPSAFPGNYVGNGNIDQCVAGGLIEHGAQCGVQCATGYEDANANHTNVYTCQSSVLTLPSLHCAP